MSRPDPTPRLFLIPFAGGNSWSFRCLKPYLEPALAYLPLELPGRGRRMKEPLRTTLEGLADDLEQQLEQAGLDSPYALFGHSMGGILAWLLAHRLWQAGRPIPRHLFVSGCRAPALVARGGRCRDELDSEAFLEMLEDLGGLPRELLAEREMMQLFEPILRADFGAVDRYRHQPRPPLPLPVTVLAGSDDREVSLPESQAWAAETAQRFRLHTLSGEHFFIHTRCDAVARLLLTTLLAPPCDISCC